MQKNENEKLVGKEDAEVTKKRKNGSYECFQENL